jgi:hypothetical protein
LIFLKELETELFVLLEAGVGGNSERLSAKELHTQAWTVVRPYFQKAQQEAVDQYKQFISSGRTSNHVRKIISAAYHGQI